MPQGDADPPEMIEMFVTDDEAINGTLRQEPVNPLLGEAALHPGRVPAGIEQYPIAFAVQRFRLDQGRGAGGVGEVLVAKGGPGQPVLIGAHAAGGGDILQHGRRVEPANLGNASDPQMFE